MKLRLNSTEISRLETDLAQHIYEFLAQRTQDMEQLDDAFEAFKDFEWRAERQASALIREYVQVYNEYTEPA